MELSFTPWMIPGLLGASVAGLAGAIAWLRRPGTGARELLVLSLGAGWWCLLQVVTVSLPTLEAKVVAAKLQYLGISTVPIAWLWFALAYTGRAARVPRAGWALLAAPEAATLALAWTNEWHGLIWKRISLAPAGSFSALRIEYGAWFQPHTYYAYALVALGTAVLLLSLIQSRYHYTRAAAVVAAALFPTAGNLLYLLGLTPPRWVDLTPCGLALGGLVLTWSLLNDDLLDLLPVARSRILDAIHDGVLVLDAGGRVLDLNPAASDLLGCRLGDVLPEAFAAAARQGAEPAIPEVIHQQGRALEISRSPIQDVPGDGTIVVVRDVTERERLHRELREIGRELVRANEELARLASTDELTGLPNRRHFFQVLEQELRRAARYQHPLALLLLDIDHFKQINDSLGHATGDLILCGISETVQRSLREVDTVGRLGGDEFAIVLPETDASGARATAQRILKRIEENSFRSPAGAELSVTVSIGLVVADPGEVDVDALMHEADMALYEAKDAGRNRMRSTSGRR